MKYIKKIIPELMLLLVVVNPVIHYNYSRACGNWKRGYKCKSIRAYINDVFLDFDLIQNMVFYISFTVSCIMLLIAYKFFKKQKYPFGYIFFGFFIAITIWFLQKFNRKYDGVPNCL